jgi:hypothetical protein
VLPGATPIDLLVFAGVAGTTAEAIETLARRVGMGR